MKAEEARTPASGMHDPDAIATMLDIAAKYDAMAQQAEGREVRARTKTKKPVLFSNSSERFMASYDSFLR
jgi:hypothetical protein